MRTAQEKLWCGRFGDKYTERQNLNLANTRAFFAKALQTIRWPAIGSVIEFGANEGHNLIALRSHVALLPGADLDAVEINNKACVTLCSVADNAYNTSVLDFPTEDRWDLVISKGLLIHIHLDNLPKAYDALYQTSSRYILIAEYFNPTPVAIEYHGEKEALWKCDFGGDMLDRYSDLECLDYGFVWKRDKHPQDNLTWWLFEK